MPSLCGFDAQDARVKALYCQVYVTKRVAIERRMLTTGTKYVGFEGAMVGYDTFVESALWWRSSEATSFYRRNVVKSCREILAV